MRIAQFWVVVFLILPILALLRLSERLDGTLMIGYLLLISSVTVGANWKDKRNARKNLWRVSERSLHILELLGGWPVAWLTQQTLKHKTQKEAYRITYACIVSLHQVIAIEILTDGQITRWVKRILAP